MFDDRAFLLDRAQWPGPICCVKTRADKARLMGGRQFGFIHESEAGPDTWKVRLTDLNGTVVGEKHYETLDALLEEWWVD